MKKRHLFISMLAALVMTGCSSEDAVTDGGNNIAGEPQYLTVNLVTNSTNGTRATGDPNNAEYEEGLSAENQVDKVRFYFFTADGDPAQVKRNADGTYSNYLEWTEISEEGKDMSNIEKILSATLIIQSPKGDATPKQIVAIINPTTPPADERSLTSLASVTGNYQTFNTSGKFVMSNSAYANNSVAEMAVSVDGKLHKTSGEALNDPVQIYVERTIAKVRLNSSLESIEGQTNTFKTSADGSQKVEIDGVKKEIFVKFLGWNTTAVADKSRLVKKINPTWPANLLGENMPWNWAEYFRSFWAINANGVNYQYGAFRNNQVDNNLFQAQAKTAFDKSQWVYVNENASADVTGTNQGNDPATPTKVIIAAQLVDADGNALEFAEYGSTRTTIDGLKTLFANNCGLYKKTSTEETTTFSKITAADLDIKTATEVGEANKDKAGRYKVYIQLTQAAEGTTWYPNNNKDAQPLNKEQANASLKSLGAAKVWKDGYTYYFFDVKHLGTKTGVVRNHIYDAKITSLSGLGTPVYNPDEIIYPEKPTDSDDTFIAAQIDILSWRVVNNDVSLDW